MSGAKGTDVADLVDATPEEIEEARALAGRAAPGLFTVLFDRWARAVDEATRLPAPRLLFEMAALDLCAAEPMVPLGDLLQRLDDMEGRLRGAPRAPGAPAPSAPPATGRRRQPAEGAGGTEELGRAARCAGHASRRRRRAPRPARQRRAAPASEPATVEEAWRRVTAAFEAKGPRLASLLAHAEVVSLSSSEVTLAFESKRDADLAEKARRGDRAGRVGDAGPAR